MLVIFFYLPAGSTHTCGVVKAQGSNPNPVDPEVNSCFSLPIWPLRPSACATNHCSLTTRLKISSPNYASHMYEVDRVVNFFIDFMAFLVVTFLDGRYIS